MKIQEDIKKMQVYFDTHETKQIKFRRKKLKALKKAIKAHEIDLIDALNSDLGKGKVEAYATEIGIVLKELSTYIKEIKNWSRTKSINTPMMQFPGKSYLMYEPYGKVLIIGPFNYPFQLVMSPLIGAIAAGNCVVIKPSEHTPQTSMVIEQIIKEVFEPEHVTVYQGEKEVTSALLDERFDYIFFTGSSKVGQIVYEKASKHLTPVTLELGGKSPTIVDDTANIKVAAERIAFGKFMNAGQTCIAPDYVLVDNKIKDKFIKALKATLKEFYGDKPLDSEDYGNVINDQHFNRLTAMIDEAYDRVLIGGDSQADALHIDPTVIDARLNDLSMKEEIFGPILPIIGYNDKEDIFPIIKGFEKPLALYIFSDDHDFVRDVFNRVSFGGGCVNDTIMHVANPYLPFGGVGHSGIGHYHGKYTFELFSHQKAYMTKSTKLESGIMFPPYKGKFRYIKQIFK